MKIQFKLNKSQIIYFLLIWIVLITLLYNNVINNINLDIYYKCSDEGQVQVFYDNKQDYPFDGQNSVTLELKNTEGKYEKLRIVLKSNNINKLRFDFKDIVNQLYINKIDIGFMGIKIKSFSGQVLIDTFNENNNLNLKTVNNYVIISDFNNGNYLISRDVGVSYWSIIKILLLITLLISIISILLINRIISILNINIKIKNINERFLIALFCTLIILPNIIYVFIPQEFKANSENRTLKEKPVLSLENIKIYPQLFDEYYNDNLPFKDYLVRLNNIIKFKGLSMSPADYVIKGKNDWLFYNSKYKNDGDTLGDYQGTNKYTEIELKQITNSLIEKKNFLEEQGIEFYLFVAPNKSQIYYENMPCGYYKNNELSKADELVNYIRKNTDIKIVYPKQELLDLKNKYRLYYKLDSHWTKLGAYIGYIELMKVIENKFEYKTLDELEIIESNINSGDLASMINLNGILEDSEYKINNFKSDISIKLIENKGKEINRYESTNDNGKKVLVYRDSYAINLGAFLTKEFEESVFLWGVPFSEDQIIREKPNIVIIEVVERLLKNLDR